MAILYGRFQLKQATSGGKKKENTPLVKKKTVNNNFCDCIEAACEQKTSPISLCFNVFFYLYCQVHISVH